MDVYFITTIIWCWTETRHSCEGTVVGPLLTTRGNNLYFLQRFYSGHSGFTHSHFCHLEVLPPLKCWKLINKYNLKKFWEHYAWFKKGYFQSSQFTLTLDIQFHFSINFWEVATFFIFAAKNVIFKHTSVLRGPPPIYSDLIVRNPD